MLGKDEGNPRADNDLQRDCSNEGFQIAIGSYGPPSVPSVGSLRDAAGILRAFRVLLASLTGAPGGGSRPNETVVQGVAVIRDGRDKGLLLRFAGSILRELNFLQLDRDVHV
ncbi:hypothetical protein NE237_032925 [Protea cynaroides]|uniref:Uncharacterized protein n=1 Tax=Protea cynaroides TaxID=273540 RepID=A0A9Q0L3X9_9MAGN|nr:hypothetical protein NE237_032925 [Protea cynaroides]